MTIRTWFGGKGLFTAAKDWTPTGVPQAGDTAIIPGGTVEVTGVAASQVTLGLGSAQQGQPAVLALKGATVGNINLDSSGPPDGPGFQAIDVAQYAIFTGTIAPTFESGGSLAINIAAHGVMVNQGTLTATGVPSEPTSITGGAGSVLVNQGLIELDGTTVTIDANTIGTGTIELASARPYDVNSQVEIGGYVGPEQTLLFSGQAAPASAELLLLDKPSTFLASIQGFAGTDTIELANTTVTAHSFSNGVLTLMDGQDTAATLHFGGNSSADVFGINESGGNTLITLTSP